MPIIPWYVYVIVGGLGFLYVSFELLTYYRKDSGQVTGRLETLNQDLNSTNMGVPDAWRQRKRAEARTALKNQLISETTATGQLEEAPKRLKEVDQATEAAHLVNVNLLSKALEMNMDVPTLLEVQKKQNFDRIDVEKRWTEIDQDLRAGAIFAEKDRMYLELHKEMIFKLYEERKLLEAENGIAKDDKLKFLNKWIKREEKVFNERTGLLQAPTQKKIKGSNKDSDFPGDIR